MDQITKMSFITILCLCLLVSQVFEVKGDEQNYILINDEKTHFACRTKDSKEYRLLPISKLCNGFADCEMDADESADGCKRKEKVLVETLEDKKKMAYISEFREAVGRAVKFSAHDELEDLLSQYQIDQYLTEHDHMGENQVDVLSKAK